MLTFGGTMAAGFGFAGLMMAGGGLGCGGGGRHIWAKIS